MFRTPKLFRFLIPASAAALAMPIMAPVASAQQAADKTIEEIITTGTRRDERTASDSSVPIDVVSGEDFESIGTPDMDDMLRNTLPSYNVQRNAIDDAATLVRPATMRGLPPDNSLVLVNGKRRHRSGVIAELGGSLAAGSQGPDISSIPAMAIKQLEVLRDGAAAQYGSDAIAGVMNFVLQDASQGFAVEGRYGEYMEGDGTLFQIGANAGFALGDDGFANITVQWREADPTSRSEQRTDANTIKTSGNPDQQAAVRNPAQIWGAPQYIDDYNVFLNSAINVSSSQEVYFFGNVGGRETAGGFFYRNPNDRGGVFTSGGYRAIVDTTIQRGDTGVVSTCPAIAVPGDGYDGVPFDQAAVDADYAILQQLGVAGGQYENCWVANLEMPGGYTPAFGGKLEDSSGVLGIRGEFSNGMSYDFSGSLGRNNVEFYLKNTWNPSLGTDGFVNGALQRDFEIGSYTQTETNFNADFVMPIDVKAFASPLNFAFGAEWRNEQFETRIGEINSWQAGRFAFQSGASAASAGQATNFYNDGVTPLPNLSVGAHGFAGFSPNQAGIWDRANYAVYVDAEADLVESFTLGAALRFEDFDDFGTTTNGKLSARWALTDTFAIRGSASTGFRAPTPGQSNVTKVSTTVTDGQLLQSGQIPSTNPIAVYLGGEALEPEDATNYTVGLVWNATDTLSLTLDFFRIELEDRIALTGSITIEDEPVPPGLASQCPASLNLGQCLQALGVPGAADLSAVTFYTNDFATTTNGVDLVATWALDFNNAGSGTLTAAWNYTKTTVDDAGEEVSRNRVVDLEHFNPRNRGIFTYNHDIGNFMFLARASFYDDWISSGYSSDPTDRGPQGTGYTLQCDPADELDKCYSSEWIFDLEAGYTFSERYSLIVGVQNVADNFGPKDIYHQSGINNDGNVYDQSTPFGQDGGFWYMRFRADFD